MPAVRPVLCAAVLAATLAVPAAEARASQIVYQCGPGVCAVDPDSGAPPRTLTGDGRVAGVTEDGRTAAWVEGSSLVLRPLEAGGADRTLFSGEIYDLPRISPGGDQALWSFYLGGTGWFTYLAPGTGTGYPPAVASSTNQTTHGWMGSTVLVTRRGTDTTVSRICAEAVGGPACDTLLATEPAAGEQIAFPDGNRAGTEIVAIRGPESTGVGVPVAGRLSVYAGGTRVRDLTDGTQDAYPSFSFEGDRVAFQRGDGIWVVSAAGGQPVRVATGSVPTWGGPRTVTSAPAPQPTPAPTPTPGTPTPGPGQPAGPGTTASGPSIASTRLRYRDGRIRVQVRCAGTATCRGTARVVRGRTVVASRSYVVRAGRSVALALRPTRAGRRLLARTRALRVTVAVRPAGSRRSTTRRLTLRR